jgi:hypothetical protein
MVCARASTKAATTSTADGLDVPAVLSELLSQPQYLHVHGPFGDGIVLPLHGIDDLVAREHPPRVAGHELEDGELRCGETDGLAAGEDFVARDVDQQVMHPDLAGRRMAAVAGAGPPQHRPHAGHEHARAERLGNVVVGAELEPVYHVRG